MVQPNETISLSPARQYGSSVAYDINITIYHGWAAHPENQLSWYHVHDLRQGPAWLYTHLVPLGFPGNMMSIKAFWDLKRT
jgi:hypothetical protein